jgi:hypothetical protein
MINPDMLLFTEPATLPDLMVGDLVSFDDCSFFQGDTLLHAETLYRPLGFAITSTPFCLRYDGWSGLLLLLCLLLAVGLTLRLRKKLPELLRSVFFPIPGKMDDPTKDDPLCCSTHLLAICLLSLTAAIVTFSYTQSNVEYYPFPEMPYILLMGLFFLWFSYFVVKRLMNGFVNWIFFRKEKIFTWKRAYTFLLVAEAAFFLVLALAVVFLPISSVGMLFMALVLVFFVKIILLFKTYQIFFSKIYGILHLIVYFCILEVIPLLVLQQMLACDAWPLKEIF